MESTPNEASSSRKPQSAPFYGTLSLSCIRPFWLYVEGLRTSFWGILGLFANS